MGTPVEGPPSLEGHSSQQPYGAYEPRGNGLSRQNTYPLDPQNSQHLAPGKRSEDLSRSPVESDHDQHLRTPRDKSTKSGSSRSSKVCGKCGEPLTGQFVRALGDTYHLECFTCHV